MNNILKYITKIELKKGDMVANIEALQILCEWLKNNIKLLITFKFQY